MGYEDEIRVLFEQYDLSFAESALDQIQKSVNSSIMKTDLNGLYSYRSKKIRELKTLLTTNENGRINNTCQNCTISEINSFDHFLPQSDYPEFSVNPKNLFPSCSICNGHKSTNWILNGRSLFLNLYLDPLPKMEYLFVHFSIKNETILTNFFLRQPFDMDNDLFELIQSHYERLDLCNRFSLNIDSILTRLINEIVINVETIGLEKFQSIVLKRNKSNRDHMGYNHWHLVLEDTAIRNESFIAFVKNKYRLG